MKNAMKKAVSVMCVIAILVFTVVVPMVHNHTCHDADCVICSVLNRLNDLLGLLLLSLILTGLIINKKLYYDEENETVTGCYNPVKQKVKLTN